jgi:hypothetical protein
MYLSSYGQPHLDLTTHLQNSFHDSAVHQMPGASGTDTPKDLTARVRIIELFTLHVLPRNGEWDYAREFIRLSKVLDEERKEAFLQALEGLKEENERGILRAAELQREKEVEFIHHMREQEQKGAEEPAAAEQQNRIARRSSEIDYGIEKDHPTSASKSRGLGNGPARLPDRTRNGSTSGKKIFSPQPGPSKDVKQTKQPQSMEHQTHTLLTVLRRILHSVARNMSGNPLVVLRTFLLILGVIMAFSRQDIRARTRQAMSTGWRKLTGTVGMGLKVSYM